MKNTVVRLLGLELKNLKNVENGVIHMPSFFYDNPFSKESDILGIYGQNGSGKTSVVNAISIIEKLLSGESLDEKTIKFFSNYSIDSESDCKLSSIKATFSIENSHITCIVNYLVEFKITRENNFSIYNEDISYKKMENGTFSRKKTLLRYNYEDAVDIFMPKKIYNKLILNDKYKYAVVIAREFSKKNKVSFIFSEDGRKIFTIDKSQVKDQEIIDLSIIIAILRFYTSANLFIIGNERYGFISQNLLIPFSFRLDEEDGISKGDIAISLRGYTKVTEKEYGILKQIINGMNLVIGKIIPNMSIEIKNKGKSSLDDGEEVNDIILFSNRENYSIPIGLESDGIIKIISILNSLIHIYNNPSMLLVVDELDAGIFEYLLGELLYEFEEGAKGQMIFTSHNLRPLEMIDKNSILFTTTNKNNRYIRFKNIKSNNNLRDSYLRSILIGGQSEQVYEETDLVEIARAFRNARRYLDIEKK